MLVNFGPLSLHYFNLWALPGVHLVIDVTLLLIGRTYVISDVIHSAGSLGDFSASTAVLSLLLTLLPSQRPYSNPKTFLMPLMPLKHWKAFSIGFGIPSNYASLEIYFIDHILDIRTDPTTKDV